MPSSSSNSSSASAPPSPPSPHASTIPTEPPLKIFTTVSSLRGFRRPLYNTRTIGFVPTMGALHAAHLDLLRQAAAENDVVAISIFVNPAQFAPTEDLGTYPRTLKEDLGKLEALNADLNRAGARGRIEALFLPEVAELYPSGIPLQEERQRGAFVTVQPLASKLEGGPRPHFFRGVATVVAKLFNILDPDRAYFGQKDVQQCVILKRMVRDLMFPVQIRVCPTGRDDDGLARSSRNVYLGEKRRRVAPVLYRALQACEGEYDRQREEGGSEGSRGGGTEEGRGVKTQLEYLSLTDKEELEDLEYIDVRKGAILSAALRFLPAEEGQGTVRIIDNVILKGE
ncbi:hypothetical protein FPQ18DRAFT_253396 [Pyronema domesticum]|nr:hypothetical protein FPQ18DRAFT_253396 [Pyronema domesticum]